jgi:hypothetical protein
MIANVRSVDAEVETIRRELVTRGMHIRIGRRFPDFVAHIDSAPNRAPVHEQFDPSGDMDGAIDAFWVCGFDPDGELIHTQAAHLLDLSKSTISGHITSHINNYFPKTADLVRSSTKAKLGPKASRMCGRVAYHGEMWLGKNHRDKGTAALVTRLGILLVVREWDPDAMFGLMNWSLACSGFNMRIGYLHSEPMTLRWEKQTNGSEHQVWLVYLEREDISFLRDLPIVEFAASLVSDFSQ